MALIQGMENANKTIAGFCRLANGGLMEGVGTGALCSILGGVKK